MAWTDAKNARRFDLIAKEIDGTLSPAERRELRGLQAEMLACRREMFPLPIEEARRVLDEAKRKNPEAYPCP